MDRLLASLNDPSFFASSDIIAMQEYPIDADSSENARLHTALSKNGYKTFVQPQSVRFGVALSYRESAFTLLASEGFSFQVAKENACAIQVLQAADGCTVCIATVHLPFKAPFDAVAEAGARVKQMCTTYKCSSWLICGDFNNNSVEKFRSVLQTATGEKTVLEANDSKAFATHCSGSDKHERYDFMFYSGPSLKQKSCLVNPQEYEQLLSHKRQQDFSSVKFFSDHAVLRASFSR